MSVPTTDPEARGELDFEAALDAHVQQRAGQPAPETAPAAPAAPPAAAPEAAQPVPEAVAPPTTAPVESDDDDEALPSEQRITRFQAREARIKADAEAKAARVAQLEAENQRAQSQIWGYQGQQKQLKAELDRWKAEATDQNAALNKIWEDGIKATDDPGQKADLQYRYDIDRRERDLVQKEKESVFKAQQAEESARVVKETQVSQAVQGMRQHAIPDLVEELDGFARQVGLPPTEIADLRAQLLAPTMAMLVQRMEPLELHTYRTNLGQGGRAEILQRLDAYKERAATQTRAELKEVYRPEQPVGQGGGSVEKPWEDLSFDEAVDRVYPVAS